MKILKTESHKPKILLKSFLLLAVLSATVFSSPAQAMVGVKPGGPCKIAGKSLIYNGKKLKCEFNGSRLKWVYVSASKSKSGISTLPTKLERVSRCFKAGCPKPTSKLLDNGYLTLSGEVQTGNSGGVCGQLNEEVGLGIAWLWVAYSDKTGFVFNTYIGYQEASRTGRTSVTTEPYFEAALKHPIEIEVVNTNSYVTCNQLTTPEVVASTTVPVRTPSTIPGNAIKVLVALVNNARQMAGVQPVIECAKLNESAAAHAMDMVEKKYFSHQSPNGMYPWDRALAVGYGSGIIGENIEYGALTADEVIGDWLGSDPHRRNLTNPKWTHVGHGVAVTYDNYNSPRGKWVEVFGVGGSC